MANTPYPYDDFPVDMPIKPQPRNFALLAFYGHWTWGTPIIPDFYWNAYTYEERIKHLCMELGKVLAYLDYMAEKLNDFYVEFLALKADWELYRDNVIPKLISDIDISFDDASGDILFTLMRAKGETTTKTLNMQDYISARVAALMEANLSVDVSDDGNIVITYGDHSFTHSLFNNSGFRDAAGNIFEEKLGIIIQTPYPAGVDRLGGVFVENLSTGGERLWYVSESGIAWRVDDEGNTVYYGGDMATHGTQYKKDGGILITFENDELWFKDNTTALYWRVANGTISTWNVEDPTEYGTVYVSTGTYIDDNELTWYHDDNYNIWLIAPDDSYIRFLDTVGAIEFDTHNYYRKASDGTYWVLDGNSIHYYTGTLEDALVLNMQGGCARLNDEAATIRAYHIDDTTASGAKSYWAIDDTYPGTMLFLDKTATTTFTIYNNNGYWRDENNITWYVTSQGIDWRYNDAMTDIIIREG